jgi:hypothetical protein
VEPFTFPCFLLMLMCITLGAWTVLGHYYITGMAWYGMGNIVVAVGGRNETACGYDLLMWLLYPPFLFFLVS